MQSQSNYRVTFTYKYLNIVLLAFILSWAIAGIPKSKSTIEISMCIFQIFVAIHYYSYSKLNRIINRFSATGMLIAILFAIISFLIICAGQDAFSLGSNELVNDQFLLLSKEEKIRMPYMIVGGTTFVFFTIHYVALKVLGFLEMPKNDISELESKKVSA